MNTYYPYVIIGAGPSGMACALSLQKMGKQPCVLEKHSFPRGKTCGGLVTEKTALLLQKLLPAADTQEIFCHQTPDVGIYRKTELLADTTTHYPMRFVHRESFDYALVRAYQAAGGCILESCGSYTVEYENNRILFGDGREIRYDYLILADGALSQSRKRLSLPLEDLMFGLETHLPATRFPVDEVRLYFDYIEHGYIWAFPYDDTVCVGVGANYQKETDYQKILNTFLNDQGIETEGLLFEGAFFPAGIPVPQEQMESNVMCVGDAAGLADPISGEGLYFALLSGMGAAKALLRGGDCKRTYLESMQPVFRILTEGRNLQRFFFQPSSQNYFFSHARENEEFLQFIFDHLVAQYRYSYGNPAKLYLAYKRNRK